MRLICGLLKGQGSVHFDDIDMNSEYETFASHLGYMPQHFGYYPHYTVKEFLEYMAIVKNLNSDYSQKRIQLLSEKLG